MKRGTEEFMRFDFPAAGEPVWITRSTEMPARLFGLTLLEDNRALVWINVNKSEAEIDLALLHELRHILHGDHRQRGALDVTAAELRAHRESELDYAAFLAGKGGPTVDLLHQWKASA